MAQIGNIPEIMEVKKRLDNLSKKGLIQEWELPYENLITRLSAAFFFISAVSETALEEIVDEFKSYEGFSCEKNTLNDISSLEYQLGFNAKSR